jgi:hypothetical protein
LQQQDQFVAAQICPVIPVEKQSERYYVYNRYDFFRDQIMLARTIPERYLRAAGASLFGGDLGQQGVRRRLKQLAFVRQPAEIETGAFGVCSRTLAKGSGGESARSRSLILTLRGWHLG